MFKYICLMLFVSFGLTACAPFGVVIGTGAAIGTMALEERGLEQAAHDKFTSLAIAKEIVQADLSLLTKVATEVVEGRILLIGRVESREDQNKILAIAWQQKGVSEVINELKIGEAMGLVQTGYDGSIRAKIMTRLLGDVEIHASNYNMEISEGTVYMIGIAQDEAERARVFAHIAEVGRVQNYIDYTQIKDSLARQENLLKLKTFYSE